MWTIMFTTATLVAAVGSVELDEYRYHSIAVFLLYAVPACRSARSLNLVPVLAIANTTKFNYLKYLRYLNLGTILRLDYFDRQTSTTKVEVGVENRFYVIEYLSIIRKTQG